MIRRALAMTALVATVAMGIPLVGADGRSADAPAAGRVHASYQPTDRKVFVLVIGTDARSGNPTNARADAIHIVGVDTRTLRGGVLNFPRDSWVSIPGHGSGKINEALTAGGPELLARTLESITGIKLDYWLMTGFEGFQAMVARLGGVEMSLRQDIYDPGGSGASIQAGKRRLTGVDSLAFVRTRKSLPGGDVTRTTNQGRFLIAMLKELRGEVARDPAAVLRWHIVGMGNTRMSLSPDEAFRLGVLATQIRPSRVGNVTVPVSIGSVGAASVVFISPGAESIYRRFERKAAL